ncbi:MAG: DUF1294 domain-containing protein [Pirellulaceae bacterium]|nr:DUF1294 domain-containing protein [Planctomycetaceae bacterium]HIM28678.1 DUF1294 domain-containing protein [Planctomycetota bacterium]
MTYFLYYLVIGVPVLSIAAFCLYWFDRRQAKHYGDRIPESTLLAVGQFGGWPGAWLAQKVLHHKTTKPSFQIQFLATVIGHMVVALALGTWLYILGSGL